MRVEILLREIREEKSISLIKLSELTNISVSQLSKIERNESEPTISTLIRISLALKTDIKNLYKIKF